jgi:hypothetical protein
MTSEAPSALSRSVFAAVEPGATYVFDLGYYDYAWWAKLDVAQCRIVTRLKSNTPLTVVEELPMPADGSILADRIGHLPARLAKSRNNPFQDPVREVQIKLDTGKVLRILCNDLDASARSPSSTSGVGRSSCSSAGSNKPSKFAAFSGPLKMPCASRSPSH